MSRPSAPSPSADGLFKRGFGLKQEIKGELDRDYHSELVERVIAEGRRLRVGDVEIRLAKEFGFCYGVDRAVDYAYETRRKFPDRRIFLTAEIIHNPRVNRRLIEMGVGFLSGQYADGIGRDDLRPEDVVLLPAFGVGIEELERLRATGCVLVDTTCGSVVHVWKRVERYAADGYTSIIHGKYDHEETRATASYAFSQGRGHYLIVRDEAEAEIVCDFIRGEGSVEAAAERFAPCVSPGFDFARDLERVGVANQTTMLSSESLRIGEMFRAAMAARYPDDPIEDRFRSFDTICTATQERQDAVIEMMADPPDVMIVIGGFNSSNTGHLREIAVERCPTFHIEGPEGLISAGRIRHKPEAGSAETIESENWLPERRPIAIGVTAGASTPNRVVGEAIERLVELSGSAMV